MSESLKFPEILTCPICGSAPDIDECAPWSKKNGPVPWYAGCYGLAPIEHFVGVNGDNRLDAVRGWNAEVEKIKSFTHNGGV